MVEITNRKDSVVLFLVEEVKFGRVAYRNNKIMMLFQLLNGKVV